MKWLSVLLYLYFIRVSNRLSNKSCRCFNNICGSLCIFLPVLCIVHGVYDCVHPKSCQMLMFVFDNWFISAPLQSCEEGIVKLRNANANPQTPVFYIVNQILYPLVQGCETKDPKIVKVRSLFWWFILLGSNISFEVQLSYFSIAPCFMPVFSFAL